ncbi:MAG: hypothetical protein H6741_21270 [Alphaproteobacteria bacterium]|nr:hypothetical protein [Alphaproteobacteria bacterium]
MSKLQRLLPWTFTALAVGAALASWSRPVPAPVTAPVAHAAVAAPSAGPSLVVAQAAPVDREALREAMREVLAEELAARPQREAPSDALRPEDKVQTEAQVEVLEDGLALVEDLRFAGEATQEDVMEINNLLHQLPREGKQQLLSAWFSSINRGEVALNGPPL